MGSSLALTGALFCLLAVGHFVLQPVSSEVCEINGNTVHSREGIFGGTLVLNAEVDANIFLFLRQWHRIITDKDGKESNLLLATSNRTNVIWKDESNKEFYSAFYKEGDGGTTKTSFKFEFKRLTCQDRGVFFCNFLSEDGTCQAKYSVNITADPLPPFIKNHTIEAEDGDEVTVICEGNVGYPAGDFAWYIVTDGIGRILPPQPIEIESAGDCRFYAKSKLVYTVKKEDHMSKFRCVARNYQQKNKDSAEVDIRIKGLTLPTTTPRIPQGEVIDKPGGASSLASLSVWILLLFTFIMTLAPSITYT